MTTSPPTTPDPSRTRLRTAVARIEHAMAALPREASSEPSSVGPVSLDELRRSWADLVALLDVGAEPALRTCPHCHQLGMRAATRCGHCWASLAPLVDDDQS